MVYTFESPATLAVASRLVDSGKVILQRPMTWRGRGVLVRRRLVRHVIIRVVNDESLRDDLRTRGLARAATYTWQRTARLTLDVYREAVRAA